LIIETAELKLSVAVIRATVTGKQLQSSNASSHKHRIPYS